jgi:hypothetical protein
LDCALTDASSAVPLIARGARFVVPDGGGAVEVALVADAAKSAWK